MFLMRVTDSGSLVPQDGSVTPNTVLRVGNYTARFESNKENESFQLGHIVEDVTLLARKQYQPLLSEKDERSFDAPINLKLPRAAQVLAGNAGKGTVTLRYKEKRDSCAVECRWRGGAVKTIRRAASSSQMGSRMITFSAAPMAPTQGAKSRPHG